MKLSELPVFFMDIQTTGVNPKSGQILEIAWGLKDERIESHVVQQPSGFIPYRIQALTGIKTEDLADAKSIDEIKHQLMNFASENPQAKCVIHYARFEVSFLKEAWGEVPFPVLCTCEIAKRLHPNLPTRNLRGLAGYYGYQKTELKRSVSHIEATAAIWRGLVEDLAALGVEDIFQLENWMRLCETKKRLKYEYPLSKEKRLALTKKPGVYRMLSKSGQVLYVGKATSLHARVNSYFRGQKGRDSRKLEMLAQVWDLDVTECGSPLEAAILEADEIKRLDPPYNVSLKASDRELAFFSRDFALVSPEQDEIHCIGPFPNRLSLDSLRRLGRSLGSGIFDENIFFDPMPAELLKEGFEIFCRNHTKSPQQLQSTRSLLALGLWLYRKNRKNDKTKVQDLTDETSVEESEAEADSDDEDFLNLPTADDIASKYERHLIRAAKSYLRSRKLTKLLNSEVEYNFFSEEGVQARRLCFSEGRIRENDSVGAVKTRLSWKGLGVSDYDRMSVLYSELLKASGQRDKPA